MFSPDFYPTPCPVIEQMCSGINLHDRHILEPSAGKGNIVDYLLRYGAKVVACEKEPNLAAIVAAKCRFLKHDFLQVTPTEVSHIDCIVMNPPFSADEKHILHAWSIAPEGCEIVALCNYETIRNPYTSNRLKLENVIKQFGSSQNLGDAFATAERKTGTTIGMVHLFKPRVTPETEFEGYFDLNEEDEDQENGIMVYSEIRNIVNRYVGAVKMFNDVINASTTMNELIKPISDGLGIRFGAYNDSYNGGQATINRDDFKNRLQKSAWKSVFNRMNMKKYVTQTVIGELNAFVEKQSNVPFTQTNVYKMIEMIVGTHQDRMNRVLVEAFEKICGYSDQNSTAQERWKTNSDYKINRRFIHPNICKYDSRWPKSTVDIDYGADSRFDDIIKALCFLTGKDCEKQIALSPFFSYKYKLAIDGEILVGYENWDSDHSRIIHRKSDLEKNGNKYEIVTVEGEWGQWYDWGFFRVRGYKKGTMHFEFIDEKVWELFNRRVAEIKGWSLPRKSDSKQKGNNRTKTESLVLF